MARVKRCLLNYENFRLRRIRETRWVDGRQAVPQDKLEKLSVKEREYLNAYNDLVDAYQMEWMKGVDGVNLTTDQRYYEEPYAYIRFVQGMTYLQVHCVLVHSFY